MGKNRPVIAESEKDGEPRKHDIYLTILKFWLKCVINTMDVNMKQISWLSIEIETILNNNCEEGSRVQTSFQGKFECKHIVIF